VTPAPQALLVLSAALLLWSPATGVVLVRARSLRPVSPSSGPAEPAASSALRRRLLAGAAGVAAGLLVGGLLGVVAAVVAAVVVERWLRSGGTPDDGPACTRALPGACDLLAVCLAAGVPVGAAVASVAAAVPPPLGAHLAKVAALHRLGAEPRKAWMDAPPALAPLGRVMVRAGESGATAAPALRALAADARAAARTAADAEVRRAGVWVLAPLGLCFLPAFVCLGVVPMVLGIAGDVFR